jgi:hypothetical protein
VVTPPEGGGEEPGNEEPETTEPEMSNLKVWARVFRAAADVLDPPGV